MTSKETKTHTGRRPGPIESRFSPFTTEIPRDHLRVRGQSLYFGRGLPNTQTLLDPLKGYWDELFDLRFAEIRDDNVTSTLSSMKGLDGLHQL